MRLLLLGLWMTSSFAFSTVESWGSVDQGDQVLADAQVKESYPMADPLGLDPRWIAADESLKECLSYSHAQAIAERLWCAHATQCTWSKSSPPA